MSHEANHPRSSSRGATSPRRAARGFSMVELLISLAITGSLLAATLGALDASFKSYKMTTESASTHVVTRMVTNRVMAMIRTGTQFGPYPTDVLDPAANPIASSYVEFASRVDSNSIPTQVIRIERRDAASGSAAPYELWYVQKDYTGGTLSGTYARPLLTGVTEASFELDYDVGPRLRRATMDLTVLPNDFQDASIGGQLETPTIRMVSSVSPRRLMD